MEQDECMVSVVCLAYNHGKYIRQTLDGFVSQKTNFKIEILIHDDASTDDTADIIREYEAKYPNLFNPTYQIENQYSKGVKIVTSILYPKAKGKYLALCEGDDYWIDPYKLQKQVDFLESHPDYGLVHTKAVEFLQEENKLLDTVRGSDFDSYDDLLLCDRIATLTTCFKKELYKSYLRDVEIDKSWKMGDFPIWLYIAANSKIYFMDEVTSVYRILKQSASHFTDWEKHIEFIFSFFDIECYFMHKYHHEYMHKRIAQRLFSMILNIHNQNHQKINISYYKRRLKVESLGPLFMLKCYLRLIKHGNWIERDK